MCPTKEYSLHRGQKLQAGDPLDGKVIAQKFAALAEVFGLRRASGS